MKQDTQFMNLATGSVDSMENWLADSKHWEGDIEMQLESLVEVEQDEHGVWRAV